MLKPIKNDHFLSISSHFSLFPQVFWMITEWPILELPEMKGVLQVVAYPILFILLHSPHWQGGLLKLMKNDHF